MKGDIERGERALNPRMLQQFYEFTKAQLGPGRKYNHYIPALILTSVVLLFTLLAIGICLYNRPNKPQDFYDRIPGVDLTGVDGKKLSTLLHELNRRMCTCSCGMTLARCRNVDPRCPVSPKLVSEIVTEVGAL